MYLFILTTLGDEYQGIQTMASLPIGDVLCFMAIWNVCIVIVVCNAECHSISCRFRVL